MTYSRPRTIMATALAIAASLLLAACGSSSPTDANSPATDPASSTSPPASDASQAAPGSATNACSLITEQEAGTALGADPGPGQASTAHAASSCMYGTSPKLVTVNLLPTGGKAAYAHARRLVPASQLADVTALGDGAFGVFKGPAAEIWFYQGDSMVTIGLIIGGTTTPLKVPTTVLAKLAAGRI